MPGETTSGKLSTLHDGGGRGELDKKMTEE